MIERRNKMPYIEETKRRDVRENGGINAGELNYEISHICHSYIKHKGLKYVTLNEVIGVLECCKQELYRTVAAKYEDKKRLANGSVSELDAINLEDVR